MKTNLLGSGVTVTTVLVANTSASPPMTPAPAPDSEIWKVLIPVSPAWLQPPQPPALRADIVSVQMGLELEGRKQID